MKKSILVALAITTVLQPAFALNKKGKKEITVTIYGQPTMGTEAEMYEWIYDEKYKHFMDLMAKTLTDMGIDSAYFMDDIKAYNNCYADAFAKSLSVSDFEIIMSDNAAKEGIINSIANKEMDKCRNKYMPYLDKGIESILPEYVSRKCALIKDADKALTCMEDTLRPVMLKLGITSLD